MKKTKEPKIEVSEVGEQSVPTVNPTGVELKADGNIELTEKDKEQFFKCFLSNSPFEDEMTLFGDKMTVKFRSISVDENNDVACQVRADQNAGIANNTEAYLTQVTVYRMALSLMSIDGVPFEATPIKKETYNATDEITYVKAKGDLFKQWNTFKLSAFLKAFFGFELKVFELERKVTDINFWKAAV